MNEYAVVKVQVKEEHSKECLSPIVLKPQGCQPCAAKYFLSLAIARFMTWRRLDGLSLPCDQFAG